ncbi:hypothetical protein [Sutterella wadsworthensis]|uniref:hypothetical protein n=1 Tax=Sutterella wadsworthensis TaxID=40545 RepID=UPI003AB9526C
MTKATESTAVETATATPAPFDFASRDVAAKAEEGAELEVLDPVTGEAVGVYITLAGADSAVHRKAVANISKRRFNNQKGFRNRGFDPEKMEAESIEILAACTLSWKGVTVEGVPLPCSRDTAIKMYTRFPWLREQAEQFIGDRSEYLQD